MEIYSKSIRKVHRMNEAKGLRASRRSILSPPFEFDAAANLVSFLAERHLSEAIMGSDRMRRRSQFSGSGQLWGWAVLSLVGCTQTPVPGDIPPPPVAQSSPPPIIQKFCGHCHAFPNPNTFSKEEWRAEVAQGFRFYEGAENLKLEVPTEEEVVAFFEAHAPQSIAEPTSSLVEPECRFQAEPPALHSSAMSVSGLSRAGDAAELWACDMRTGAILKSGSNREFSEVARPVELANPSRLSLIDLHQDGQQKILASDLGSFFPQDHRNGAVWQLDPANSWKATPILQGVARVCDVRAGDLDGDRDLDLVVAEFGWRRSGRVLILWNSGNSNFETWKQQVLDSRHGAIDVPLVDLNGDGRLDIVVLLTQEFETVLAYLNQGDEKFEPHVIYEAGEPSFGSSGIQTVDFDLDGDTDVIHTNGDSFDSSHVKPFHGIRWLENPGSGQFPYAVHDVAQMAGVHRAVAGDIDQDGDLDLAAVSLLPPSVMQRWSGLPSVIWLERTGEGFDSHVIEIGSASHATCALVDGDSDGDLDLVATNFRWQEEAGSPVTWYLNQKPQATAAGKP